MKLTGKAWVIGHALGENESLLGTIVVTKYDNIYVVVTEDKEDWLQNYQSVMTEWEDVRKALVTWEGFWEDYTIEYDWDF